jgi:tripartite-type tricarboxylate transporter receptor subunit TctC
MNLKLWSARAIMALTVLAGANASAQTYPAKPVSIVVPYPAGGATDVIARLVAQRLSATWGQPVIVNNRPGAGTLLGAESVAKAPGDCYTLYMTTAAHTISASLYKKLPYDPFKDFAPITLTSVVPLVLVASNSVPAKSLPELISYLKAHPGSTFASTGNGTPQHLTSALFNAQNKLEMTHVPYRGDAPMLADIIGNQVQIAFVTLSAALPHIKAGKIRAIALAHSKRVDALPEVPTFAQSGGANFEAATWFGLLAPASLPASLKKRIYEDVSKAVATPELSGRLVEMGGEVSNSTPEKFETFMQAEAKNWAQAVKLSGAQID